MTNTILTENNFNGNWRLIPSNNGIQTQLILSKNILNKNGESQNIIYNFNYDIKNHVIGRPISLMNELLGLNKNQFYKCIIDNESLTFIIMNETEINEYESSIEKDYNEDNNHEDNNHEDNNQSISLNSITYNIESS